MKKNMVSLDFFLFFDIFGFSSTGKIRKAPIKTPPRAGLHGGKFNQRLHLSDWTSNTRVMTSHQELCRDCLCGFLRVFFFQLNSKRSRLKTISNNEGPITCLAILNKENGMACPIHLMTPVPQVWRMDWISSEAICRLENLLSKRISSPLALKIIKMATANARLSTVPGLDMNRSHLHLESLGFQYWREMDFRQILSQPKTTYQNIPEHTRTNGWGWPATWSAVRRQHEWMNITISISSHRFSRCQHTSTSLGLVA